MRETPSLKSLAFKALERLERNTARNKRETLHDTKNGSWVKPLSLHPSVLEEYEERLAIAEVDGHQTPLQAERIAYQDAFIAVLSTLPCNDHSDGDWLNKRIQAAKEWLSSQGLVQPK